MRDIIRHPLSLSLHMRNCSLASNAMPMQHKMPPSQSSLPPQSHYITRCLQAAFVRVCSPYIDASMPSERNSKRMEKEKIGKIHITPSHTHHPSPAAPSCPLRSSRSSTPTARLRRCYLKEFPIDYRCSSRCRCLGLREARWSR